MKVLVRPRHVLLLLTALPAGGKPVRRVRTKRERLRLRSGGTSRTTTVKGDIDDGVQQGHSR